jgi:DNA-binding Xre family transcriptional regulator
MKMISKLPELMKKRGVDQKTVAFHTGLSPTTVSKLYRNHFDRVDSGTITALCKYFELRSLSDLLEIERETSDKDFVVDNSVQMVEA